MGCYLSKKHLRDSGRIFRVYNVNDLRTEVSPGKIEVTEADLIFYQKGKEPIRWPLRCLRRYGFDEELFSFESGRRCTTGSNIYAFKCRRAEELFNLVQESIQNMGQTAHMRSSQTLNNTAGMPGRQNGRPASMLDPHEPNGIHLSDTGRVVVNDQHLYMNGTVIPTEDSTPNYINTGANRADNNRNAEIDHATALIDFLHDPPFAPKPPKLETVNYADLDLPGSTENLVEQCDGACAMDSVDNRNGTPVDLDMPDGLPLDIDEVALNYADLDVFTDAVGEDNGHPTYINLDAEGNFVDKNLNSVATASAGAIKNDADAGKTVTINGKGNGENGCVKKRLLVRKLSIEQNYTNVGAMSFSCCPEPSPVTANPPPPTFNGTSNSNTAVNRLSNPGELNYIEIDVNKTEGDTTPGATSSAIMSVSYTAPDSPRKPTESYAMIDFNRTVALSNSAKPVSDDGEGLRKTRHNSTIN